MRVRRFEWEGAFETARAMRRWAAESLDPFDVAETVRQISGEVSAHGDRALIELTERYDGVSLTEGQIEVGRDVAAAALEALDPSLREAMELAAANVRAVAEAQLTDGPHTVELPQGQTATVRELPVGGAGVYAPGGLAAYPSSVLMCAIPARVAGVERIALVSPPGAEGRPPDPVLAAAALCEVDEIYAVGGAQAVFGLAFGTEAIPRVDVVVGPGNAWVQEAKRRVLGEVGIDSYAGPSELVVVSGHDVDPEWAALDLCAQAEHGEDGALAVVAVEQAVLDGIAEATERAAAGRPGVGDSPLALIQVPNLDAAVDLANAFAPEHLELLCDDAELLADRVTTAGCVFVGPYSATAFGDYVAGSNHVLPTGGAGRFSGPLGPDVFRRKIATVEIPAGAAAKLAPHVRTLAEAEGFPVHGESAMIRAEDG
jgi:histidinol dehydrogenase